MKVFTTPRFQTAFDPVAEPLEVPGVLTSGQPDDLVVIDCMARGVAVIGRFVASPALLGVKVAPTGRPVRVTAHFSFDAMALGWWQDLVPADVSVREAALPRLLLVRSQGSTRAAVLLNRQGATSGVADGVVSFDLRPDELSSAGLFILEVVSVDSGRPSWAPAASVAAVGVMLKRIEFTEVEGDRDAGLTSTGSLPAAAESTTWPIPGEYFVANPSDGTRSWIARATLIPPPAPVEPGPAPAPVPPPAQRRQSAARILKRRAKRAARWVVPIAAVPVAKKTSRRAAALKRKMVRMAKGRPVTPPPPPPAPVVPPGPPPNPLAEAMADLVSRNVVLVELAGLEGRPVPGVQVRAQQGAEIEIVTDGPLRAPALVRLAVDPSALGEVPGIDEGATVRWDLVVRAGS